MGVGSLVPGLAGLALARAARAHGRARERTGRCWRHGNARKDAARRENGEMVWRVGSAMSERAERERFAESQRKAPKTYVEALAYMNAHA